MSDDFQFSHYTPMHHEDLDTWGLGAGTRVWMASGSFQPVGDLEAGDHVFGQTFMKEDVGLGGDRRGEAHLAKAWRPRLTERKVLGVRSVQARAWQLTFGDAYEQYESRRLVAGAETEVGIFPVSHKKQGRVPLCRCPTAKENPRVESETRRAQAVAEELEEVRGTRIDGAHEYDQMPRGELAVIIPFEAYGGQIGMFDSRVKNYNRYVFNEVHEIVPLQKSTKLVQVIVQPDTEEKFGIGEDDEPRANLIAQTPFKPETEETTYVTDPAQRAQAGMDSFASQEAFNQAWEQFVANAENRDREVSEGDTETQERTKQGVFYKSLQDEELAEGLSKMGVENGFLDGGILVPTPRPSKFT